MEQYSSGMMLNLSDRESSLISYRATILSSISSWMTSFSSTNAKPENTLVFFILTTFKILCIMSCCNNTFYIRDLKSFMGWWLMVGRRWESFDSNLDTEHSDGFTTISAWHQLVITKERVPELSFLFISIMLWSVRRANLDKGGLECYRIHFLPDMENFLQILIVL